MPGLDFGTSARLRGGVKTLPQARYGSVPSPRSPSEAAYGPSFTTSVAGPVETFKPNDPFGIAFMVGVACIAGLAYIYSTLPN